MTRLNRHTKALVVWVITSALFAPLTLLPSRGYSGLPDIPFIFFVGFGAACAYLLLASDSDDEELDREPVWWQRMIFILVVLAITGAVVAVLIDLL